MKNRKIIFFTELGEGTSGSGHFNRCLLLLSKLKYCNSLIIITNNKNKLSLKIKEKYNVKILNNQTKKFLKKITDDALLIIDLYNPLLFLKKNSYLNKYRLIIFNDLEFIKSSTHILINPQSIKKFQNNNYYKGLNYFPLNEDLKKIRKKIKIKKEVKKIFVFIGAFPKQNYVLYLKNFLEKNINPKIEIHFFTNYQYMNKKNFKFKSIKNNYYNNISKYDLAIISGGFIKFELMYLGIPTLFFTIEKHQTILSKLFSKNSMGKFIMEINIHNFEYQKALYCINNLIKSYNMRKKMFNYSRKKIDGNGLQNLINLFKKI